MTRKLNYKCKLGENIQNNPQKIKIKKKMRLSSIFYHIVNKDRCTVVLNKQCKCKFKIILIADLMQTLPYCYKTEKLSYCQESYIK